MECNIITNVGYTGYGVVGRNLAVALQNAGVKVSLFPIGQIQCPYRQNKVIEKMLYNAYLFNKYAPSLRIWHQNDMALFPGVGKRIGYTFFERNLLNEVEIHHLKQLDACITASKWSQDILLNHSINSTILPCGVDTDVFTPRNSNQTKCIFLNIGKFEVRKGHLELAQAFEKAFRGNSDVELWLCCHNRFYQNNENDWWYQYYREFCGTQVKFIPWQSADTDIASIMQRSSCGIFPAKAEGWNLELLEMMACGKPVIATNYSGHTGFCNQDNCLLIEPDGMEPAVDACPPHPNGFWFKGYGEWAKTNIDTIANQMTNFYTQWKNGYVTNQHGIETANKHSWNNIANTFIEAYL